ncbi:hypothetical protein [Xanthomonas arboricola]|uniref:hypothetical protein n=1 Tax=Xanthomonas arboricola TaxID=56448 RepID=UPI0014317776|nr:hypothetical protein [Xanthomonas arboricola]NJB78386.1 hypothetical protein [Xanthomonas arboricola]
MREHSGVAWLYRLSTCRRVTRSICVYSVTDYGAISALAITCVRATHRRAKVLQQHVAVRVGDQQTIAQAVRQTVEDASARTVAAYPQTMRQ